MNQNSCAEKPQIFLKGCHGIPERCLVINGRRMIICARCFGLRIGYYISFALFLADCAPPLWVSLLIIIPMVIDGGIQAMFRIISTNTRRLLTGILGGIGLGSFLLGVAWGMAYSLAKLFFVWLYQHPELHQIFPLNILVNF